VFYAWLPDAPSNPTIGVIGKPLSDVFIHASLSLSIAGTQQFVPTIVVKCIEELYRTGKIVFRTLGISNLIRVIRSLSTPVI
jgi:hypothetical protein